MKAIESNHKLGVTRVEPDGPQSLYNLAYSHEMAPLRIAFIHPDLGIGAKLTVTSVFLF
jgi:hypothetical protein